MKCWWEGRRGLLHYWSSSLVRKILIIHIQAFSKLGSDARRATDDRLCNSNPTRGVFLWAQMMSHDDRFTSAIVRHVCGVRSLCKSCSGQSAASLVCSERVEWRSNRWGRPWMCVCLSPLPLSFCLSIAKKNQKNFGYNNTTTTTDNKIFFIFCVMIKISFQIQGAGRFKKKN